MDLSHLDLFKNMDPQLLEMLVTNRQLSIKSYPQQQTLYNQQDPCRTLDLVLEGRLVAYALSQRGSESIVFEFSEGEVIGAGLLYGKQNRYPMTIYCTQPCRLLHLAKEGVTLLLKDPHFVMTFVELISFNSQGMNQKIAMHAQRTLRDNLSDYLLALAAKEKSDQVTLPVSKKQLADILGVQRPSLFRELKKMREEGLIQIHGRTILLSQDLHPSA